jgi:5-hydroxyisourate hydrolase-like protein (transthyretin family)
MLGSKMFDLSRQIPQTPTTGTVTGQVVDNATGAPIQGAEVPVIDANGNSVTGITDENGNFQTEITAGEAKVNMIVYNGITINVNEIVFNVTIGEVFNIGVVGVDWI